MNRKLLFLLTAVLALIGVSAVAAQDDMAYVRVAHNAADVGSVDVWINNERSAITNFGFGTVTDWVELPAGVYKFAVGETGGDEAPFTINTRLNPGTYTTISAIISPAGRPQLTKIDEVARVRVAHLAETVGPVDVFVDGELSPITNSLSARLPIGSNSLPAATTSAWAKRAMILPSAFCALSPLVPGRLLLPSTNPMGL